jgi:hypothetical protein
MKTTTDNDEKLRAPISPMLAGQKGDKVPFHTLALGSQFDGDDWIGVQCKVASFMSIDSQARRWNYVACLNKMVRPLTKD